MDLQTYGCEWVPRCVDAPLRSGLDSLKSAIEILASNRDSFDDTPEEIINLCQQLWPTVDQVKEQFSLAAEECEKEQEATKVETEVLLQTIHQYQKEEERFETEIKQLENEKEGLEKKLEAENKVLSTKQKELNKLQDTLDKQQKLYEEAKDRHNGPAAALSFGSLGVGGVLGLGIIAVSTGGLGLVAGAGVAAAGVGTGFGVAVASSKALDNARDNRDEASNARDRAEDSVNEIERKIDKTSHQLQNKRQTLNNTKERKNSKERELKYIRRKQQNILNMLKRIQELTTMIMKMFKSSENTANCLKFAFNMDSVINAMESLMVTLEGEQGRLPYHFQSLRNKLSSIVRMQSNSLNFDSDSDCEW